MLMAQQEIQQHGLLIRPGSGLHLADLELTSLAKLVISRFWGSTCTHSNPWLELQALT